LNNLYYVCVRARACVRAYAEFHSIHIQFNTIYISILQTSSKRKKENIIFVKKKKYIFQILLLDIYVCVRVCVCVLYACIYRMF